MDLFFTMLSTVMVLIFCIWTSRIISMTYKTFGRSLTIKNDKLAVLLIAEKNTWGIATDSGKRNRMSLWGVISYIMFLPQIVFVIYNWWIYIETGSGQWCEAEQSYFAVMTLYYMIALSIKLKEAIKFSEGEIW